MTPRWKIIWLVVLALGVFWLLARPAHGSAMPPLPPAKRVNPATTSKGAGATALLSGIKAKPKLAIAPVGGGVYILWVYPNCATSNYWWNLMTATNTSGPWSVMQSNITGTVTVTNDLTEAKRFFRMEGTS